MFTLPKCQSGGTLEAASATSVFFDSQTGQATFANFSITSTGMYLVLINVQTVGSNDYNFNCFSKPIIVKEQEKNIQFEITEETSIPNFYFKFDGDFDALTPEKIEQFKSIFYNCIILKYNLTLSREIAVYKGSIVVDTFVSGQPAMFSNLIQDLNSTSGFSLENGIDLLYAKIFDSKRVYKTISGGGGSGGNIQDNSSLIDTEQEKNIKKNAVMFIYLNQL